MCSIPPTNMQKVSTWKEKNKKIQLPPKSWGEISHPTTPPHINLYLFLSQTFQAILEHSSDTFYISQQFPPMNFTIRHLTAAQRLLESRDMSGNEEAQKSLSCREIIPRKYPPQVLYIDPLTGYFNIPIPYIGLAQYAISAFQRINLYCPKQMFHASNVLQ